MTTKLEEDNYLTIQLIRFNRPTKTEDSYYFLEMSTLQVTTLLTLERKIISSQIVAYTSNNKYLDEHIMESWKTIRDFNHFFMENPDYYIHNCELLLEKGLKINSHDDGEVSIQMDHSENCDQLIIDTIFQKYNLDKKLKSTLQSKPGHYMAIDGKSNVIQDFETFDDYITGKTQLTE